MTHELFCFGLGYTARNFIQTLKEENNDWQFSGTCRTNATGNKDCHIFDGTSPIAKDLFADATHILISIPPQDEMGDPVLHHLTSEIAQLKNLKWLGYLSTTGVYGDRKGGWVNDDTAPAPTSTKGRQRRDAELGWLNMCRDHDIPVHIFRLGSIYGPGKGHLANLHGGNSRKIIKENHYFSRIHVTDLTQVLVASLTTPNPGQTYNLVDDLPAPTADVLDYICDLLHRPPLPAIDFHDAPLSPMMKIFYAENKRVRNDRIKQELGVTLTYPTYKEGFKALVESSLTS